MIAHVKKFVLKFIKARQALMKRLFILMAVVVLAVVVSVIFFALIYAKKIYPGVVVGDVSLGGLSFKEAGEQITKRAEQLPAVFVLTYEGRKWQVSREQLGASINIERTLDEAVSVGRRGSYLMRVKRVLNSFADHSTIEMSVDWDDVVFQKETSALAAEVEKLPEGPGVWIDKGSVVISRGRNGQVLRRDVFKRELENRLKTISPDNHIRLTTQSVRVELTSGEEAALKTRAERLLGNQLILNYPVGLEEKSIVLTDKELVGFLAPEMGDKINEAKLADYMTSLADVVNKLPVNAVFQFVPEQGKVAVFKPAEEGVSLDRPKAAEKILSGVLTMTRGERKTMTIELPVMKMEPEVTTETVNNLGIKELLGRGISYFPGSISGRIHNIIVGTSRVNGTLLAPGEEFSFNKAIGEISANTGYQQAYVIKEGRTVLGDGGGVCQISTTLFRAVLAAGLPIVERWAHAYRVHYYEVKSQVGLDATVYAPSVDFKFKNDTSGYILVQADVDQKAQKVSFELYGASDGRQATISKTRIWDVTAPPPDLYQDDPTLPVGKVRQVDFSAWGAKTAFDWTVERNGEVLQKKTFYSNYQPWRAVFLKGTKQI